MLTDKQIIEQAWRTGQFANPKYPDAHNIGGPSMADFATAKPPKELAKLTLNDSIVRQAIASYQGMMAIDGDRLAMEHHARPMIHDGDVGPATRDLFEVARCAVPDYSLDAEPAVGTGNWSRCHGVGNFHRSHIYIDRSTMPAFLVPIWEQVWANVLRSSREIGCDLVLVDDPRNCNSKWSWTPLGGPIGLAIVGRNLKCDDSIWARYEPKYQGGSTTESRTNQQSSLCQHEDGHNKGLPHTRGGIMNPSIINGLPMGTWKNDPSEPVLKRLYGGEPVPGGNPLPPDVPQPPTGGGDIPRVSLSVTVPEGFKPGTYQLVAVPRPEV